MAKKKVEDVAEKPEKKSRAKTPAPAMKKTRKPRKKPAEGTLCFPSVGLVQESFRPTEAEVNEALRPSEPEDAAETSLYDEVDGKPVEPQKDEPIRRGTSKDVNMAWLREALKQLPGSCCHKCGVYLDQATGEVEYPNSGDGVKIKIILCNNCCKQLFAEMICNIYKGKIKPADQILDWHLEKVSKEKIQSRIDEIAKAVGKFSGEKVGKLVRTAKSIDKEKVDKLAGIVRANLKARFEALKKVLNPEVPEPLENPEESGKEK